MIKYNLKLTHKQLRVIETALDLYARIGIGQLEIIAEKLNSEFFIHDSKTPTEWKKELNIDNAKENMGLDNGSNFGIGNDKVSENSNIAYEIDKVIQKKIAEVEEHQKYSTWYNGVVCRYSKEPIAEIEEVQEKVSE
jgi:hypothetical protein